MSHLDVKIKILSDATELFKKIVVDFKLSAYERIVYSLRLQLLASLLGDLDAKIDRRVLAPFERAFQHAGLDINNYVGKTVNDILTTVTHKDPEVDAVFKAFAAYVALYNAVVKTEELVIL